MNSKIYFSAIGKADMAQFSKFSPFGKYMPIQWKIVLLVLLVSVSTVSAVVWKTQSLVIDDKADFLAESAVRQAAPLKRLVQTELLEVRERLVQFAAARTSSGAGRARAFGDFEVVALVQPIEGGQWSPSWVEKGPAAAQDRWSGGHDVTLLKSLPYAKVRDGELTWVRVSDPKGLALYAVLFSVELAQPQATSAPAAATTEAPAVATLPDTPPVAAEAKPAGQSGKRAIVVGFTPSSPLAGTTEDYIGSLNTALVVDDRGYVASHPNKGLLGALFTEDPLVDEIVRTQKSLGTGRFEDREHQQTIGHFERVDHSNLFVAVSTPLNPVQSLADLFRNTALATGAGVAILCLLLAWLIGRGISKPLQATIDAIRALSAGSGEARIHAVGVNDEIGELTHLLSETPLTAFASRPELVALANQSPSSSGLEPSERTDAHSTTSVAFMQELSQEKLASERRAAYEAFSLGLGSALREPLHSILGHAQLVRSKTGDSEVVSHAQSIEREARRARAVVERLQGFAFDETESLLSNPVELTPVVNDILAKVEKELSDDGITVVRDLRPVPRVKGAVAPIEISLVQLIENAREAMRGRTTKRLEVRQEFLGDNVLVSISDTGIGMSRDMKTRAFEPFNKGFQSPERMGLGLSFVQAAMRRSGGDCLIESVPGEGSTVTLKFRVEADERRAFLDRVVAEKSRAEAKAPQPTPVEAPVAAAMATEAEAEVRVEVENEADDEMKFTPAALPLSRELNFEEPAGPAKAHPIDAGAVNEDDDDDDAFSNVPLSKMNDAPKAEATLPAAPVTAPSESEPKTRFKLNIRRPRPGV